MRDVEITVYGLVQGVGFRPFVAEAAREFSLTGTVCNIGGIVKIRAVGDEEALDEFIRRLSSHHLSGCRVDEVVVSDSVPTDVGEGFPEDFQITDSVEQEDELRFLPADIATCESCERELMDPENRRYRHPFISCVSCGPRFSIMKRVPYDRERTTMGGFPLCGECEGEYLTIGDRRRYAQTIACNCCGPTIQLFEGDSRETCMGKGLGAGRDRSLSSSLAPLKGSSEESSCRRREDSSELIKRAVELIHLGRIVAIKDIGGYHFCFDPYNEEAARRLREYKNRERKPLAVMFRDMDKVRDMAVVSAREEELLRSPARPIVLLDKKEGEDFAPSVCGRSRRIGAMLPCNPLQMLLLEEYGTLVMTSGNRGGEPIVTEDEVMLREMEKGFPDAVLLHDREIVNGLDDSILQVVKLWDGREFVQTLRRARGYVPEPVRLPFSLKNDWLAAGGDLKAVFALGRKNMAYLSGHFGDLEDVRAEKARAKGIEHLQELLGIRPKGVLCDSHPGYRSAKEETSEERRIRCQHHVSHIASVMVEHGLQGPVLGLAFDGTGYGDDGTVWGSEFLLCGEGYRRMGCFQPVKMTGGDTASRNAKLSCYAYLHAARERELLTEVDVRELLDRMDGEATANDGAERTMFSDGAERTVSSEGNNMPSRKAYTVVSRAIESGTGTYLSSSMGRLFDAVSALLGIGYANSYEGECAENLQAVAEKWLRESGQDGAQEEPLEVWAPVTESHGAEAGKKSAPVYTIDGVFLVAGMGRLLLYGEEPRKLAAMFHLAVAEASVDLCGRIAEAESLPEVPVALGGGTMCNRLLLQYLIPKLEQNGHPVYFNHKVPCGDGGLALGQFMAAPHGKD